MQEGQKQPKKTLCILLRFGWEFAYQINMVGVFFAEGE